MRVITISGKARHGKDSIASALKEVFDKKGIPCMIVHYADFLKMILKNYYGIDCSEKSETVRQALQHIGTDVFRKNNPDCWVNMMLEFIKGLGDTVKVVVISDCRFPNEITKLRDSIYIDGVFSVLVKRENFENDLTLEQRKHSSETALDGWEFDCIVNNDADLKSFLSKAEKIVELYNFSQKKEIPVI